MMPYDRPAVAAYFDQLAEGEWQRFGGADARHGFRVEALAASNALSTNLEPLLLELRQQPNRWQALLDLEAKATAEPGYVDGGTHLIVVARSE